MKKFRKIMAVLVAAMMIISSFTLTAFADDTLKITIDGSLNGETYTAYKIFNETYATDHTDTGNYVRVPYTEVTKEQNVDVKYYLREIDDPGDPPTTPATYKYTPMTDAIAATLSGESYVVEKVESPVAYTIKGDSDWYTLAAAEPGITLTEIVGYPATTYLVKITEGTFSPSHFAEQLKNQIDNVWNAEQLALVKGRCAESADASGNNLEINVTTKGAGYYFVDTTLGLFCALDSTTPTVTVKEKNSVPSIDKFVYDTTTTSSTKWVKRDDAQIGDDVFFKIEVTDGKGTDNAIDVYDSAEAGLTIDTTSIQVMKVKADEPSQAEVTNYFVLDADGKTPVPATNDDRGHDKTFYEAVLATNYTTVASFTTPNDKIEDTNGDELPLSFKLTFNAAYVKSLATAEKVYIFYKGYLNETAEMAGDSNDNRVLLTYSAQMSPTITTKVYTYQLDLVKDNESGKLLDGAEFKLYRASDFDKLNGVAATGKTDIPFWYKDSEYIVKDGVSAAPTGFDTATAIKPSKTGAVNLKGLDVDTYYLVETKAPNGYYPLTAPIEIEITADTPVEGTNTTLVRYAHASGAKGAYAYTLTGSGQTGEATVTPGVGGAAATYGSGGLEVVNEAGKELPTTGGMGTTVLYIVGGMLVILAGAYLFFSRKKTA